MVLSAFTLACGDSAVAPWASSPVGRYELVGCTWGGDTDPAHMAPGCGTGGTARHDWTSGVLLVNADGTMSRTMVEKLTDMFSPIPMSWTDTSVVTGSWTNNGRVLHASWSGFSYDASTDYTRVGTDLLRDNSIWNETLYFWYRRAR